MQDYTGSYDGSLDRLDNLEAFLRNYYKDEIGELVEKWPSEQDYLEIDWQDLHTFNADIADDYITAPEVIGDDLQTALEGYDLPVDIDLTGVDIRVVGLNNEMLHSPMELSEDAPDGYVGVQGELAKVTTPSKELKEAVFECQRCGTHTTVPQGDGDVQEPRECVGCERKGPFTFNTDESTFQHYCKVRIETPASDSGELQDEHIDGFVRGSLVWQGDDYGLVARSGDPATVYGELTLKQKDGKGENPKLFDEYLDVQAIEFDEEQQQLDIPKHKDRFVELANRDDAIDIFAESLVPELYATPEWERALELLVAYLFAAPRIDIDQGPTYRGDIHALIISDYGMGKSMVNSAIAEYSPKCIKESVTGMSSDVGLLAAAVEDDFGAGQWTLKPGILVRANGGHVILDEIDKTDADLERMNDAMEGEQIVDVNKAGQSASYKSRVGVLATGNPPESRFNKMDAIAHQIGLDESFLSRFDGIITMQDEANEDQDAKIAETQGMSYIEAQEKQYGDREELDQLDRVVDVDLGRNWIAYARENVYPKLQEEQVEQIKDWYAEEVRRLNKSFASKDGEGGDMPVPANSRTVMNTIRCAVAFARAKLQDEVTDQEVERAMSLSRDLVGQNFDGEKFTPAEVKNNTQADKMTRLENAIPEDDAKTPAQIASAAGLDEGYTADTLEKLAQKGEVLEPQQGEYRNV